MKFVDVAVPNPRFDSLKYSIPDDCSTISCGDYVSVEIKNTTTIGVVLTDPHDIDANHKYKIKPLFQKLDLPAVNQRFLKFIEYAAKYNMTSIGTIIRLVINPNLLNYTDSQPRAKKQTPREIPQLSTEQSIIREELIKTLDTFSVNLLDGETGSGKTEIYCSLIYQILKIDPTAQVLILLPEIILVSQLMKKLTSYFHQYTVVELHSGISGSKKQIRNYKLIMDGTANIIVGARSALFKPYKNLKLIVVDEEHDGSFKSEQCTDSSIYAKSFMHRPSNSYNARDMAILLSKYINIPIILSSATPSLETFYNASIGKYNHYIIKNRFGASKIPNIIIEDMHRAQKEVMLSNTCKELIKRTLDNKNQVLIFLNKRGYAPITICTACDHKIKCEYCSGYLNFHKKMNVLSCSYCSNKVPFKDDCPNCQSNGSIKHYGLGIEKLEEEIIRTFEGKKIAILSSDTTKKNTNSIMDDMLNGGIDILIGTQIIAKGHNFEKLTLVVIIDAESSVIDCDLRSYEKSYQLLHQVAGRSGRYEECGTVVVQTHEPDSPLINAIKNYDKQLFYKLELESRKQHKMPPFIKLRAIIIANKNPIISEEVSEIIAKKLSHIKDVEVLGPIQAPIEKINNMYRYRILIKTEKSLAAQMTIEKILKNINHKDDTIITVDIDPKNFI